MGVFRSLWASLKSRGALCVDPGATQFRVATFNPDKIQTDTLPFQELWARAQNRIPDQTASSSQHPLNLESVDTSAQQALFGGGKIIDFIAAEAYAKSVMRLKSPFWHGRPQGVIAVSIASNTVERRAMQELFELVGLRKVYLIETPMAAAIGAGLVLDTVQPVFVGVLGAVSCEFAIIRSGRVVAHATLPFGWYDVLRAVGFAVRQRYGVWPDQDRLEAVLQEIGVDGEIPPYAVRAFKAALPPSSPEGGAEFSAEEARHIMRVSLAKQTYQMINLLDYVEPSIADTVRRDGGVLAGGMGQLNGLTDWLGKETGMRLYLAKDPRKCVIRGIMAAYLTQFNM